MPNWQYFCHMSNLLTHIDSLLKRLEGAYAPNTLRSYYADACWFVDWCYKRNLTPFPLGSNVLCACIEWHQGNYTYASLRRRIVSLRRINTLLGYDDHSRTEDVYLAIRRLKRSIGRPPKQAAGINESLLSRMIAAQPSTLVGIRNRALLSLGYDFLARRSELVALRTCDVTQCPDGTLRGIIRRSKTDQFGQGRLVFGSTRSAKLLKTWLRHQPRHIEPLFCAVNSGTCLDRALCDRSVNEIIKRSLLKVKGVARPNYNDISGHSLRVGAAQDLLIKGYDIGAIMRAGGWSDVTTVSRYLKYSEQNVWAEAY